MTNKELKVVHGWATEDEKDMKTVNEWKDGVYASDAITKNEIEFDVNDGLDTFARVIYLRKLGYKFDNWSGYVQAEINELISKAA